jgi:dihydropteroate synthase
MIYKKLNITPEEALPGTIALNTIALKKGASILRVHDVAAAIALIRLLK